jgi:hypothetical protein
VIDRSADWVPGDRSRRADLETIIADLMSGQFNDPIRVGAFNRLEHWREDVTEDIALRNSNPL